MGGRGSNGGKAGGSNVTPKSNSAAKERQAVFDRLKAAETKKKSTKTSGSFQVSVENAVRDSNNNINRAIPAIRKAMSAAPVGTELTVDAYYNEKAGGMLQNVFKKTAKDKWTLTWRVKNGQIYWTNQATAADLFNAYIK